MKDGMPAFWNVARVHAPLSLPLPARLHAKRVNSAGRGIIPLIQ